MHRDTSALNVDPDDLRLAGKGVSELTETLDEIRTHVDAMTGTLPLGSSPQAHDLGRKFTDRTTQFRDLLHTMGLQLAVIADQLDSTGNTYREVDGNTRATFAES